MSLKQYIYAHKNNRKNRIRILVVIFLAVVTLSIISNPAIAGLHSFEKSYPYGYENRLDPNVLILIDTSGSMLHFWFKDESTGGDGGKPYLKDENSPQLYFGTQKYEGGRWEDQGHYEDQGHWEKQGHWENGQWVWVRRPRPAHWEWQEGQVWVEELVWVDEGQVWIENWVWVDTGTAFADANDDPLSGDYHPNLKYISVDDFQNAFQLNYGPGKDQYYGLKDRYPDKVNKIKDFFNSDDCNYKNPFDENETPTEWIRKADYFRQVYYYEDGRRFTDYWYSDTLSNFGQPTSTDRESDDPDFDPVNDTKYRYPNDSRLYIVKQVLTELLYLPELVGDMNIGIATFDNKLAGSTWFSRYYNNADYSPNNYWFPTDSYSYSVNCVPSFSSSYAQYYGRKRIDLLTGGISPLYIKQEDGSSYEATESRDVFLSLIDGEDTGDHKEIRSVGGTPLYYAFSERPDVFNPSSAGCCIENWCQQNWVIVLTDGKDNEKSANEMGNVVAALYNDIDNTSQRFNGKDISNINTLVISMTDEAVGDMREICDEMADAGDDGDHSNHSSCALEATNLDELRYALSEAFRTIKDFSSSAGSPLVTVEQADNNSGTVYQASYIPNTDEMWNGYFKKYVVADLISPDISSAQWDAGEKLKNRSGASRNVFTVTYSGSTVDPSVPFEVSHASSLKENLGLDETSSEGLIRDLLGVVSEDKLGDIYHSGFVKIGLPGSEEISEDIGGYRDTMIYVQANDGMLHAFYHAGNNAGEERWAFIPPNVLSGGRLAGLKKDSNGEDLPSGQLSSRYLCDGPIIAEDIQDGDTWKTVVLGTLGWGGAGIYAMDVTDPSDPQFMWAIENDVFDEETETVKTSGKNVKHWTNDSFVQKDHGSVSSSLDYKDLCFPLSTPFVGKVTLGSGQEKWVAVMGNGSGRGITTSAGKVYLVDVTDGTILKSFTSQNMGNIVSPVVIPAPLNSNDDFHVIEQMYFADDQGTVYKANIENDSVEKIIRLSDEVLESTTNGFSYSMDLARIGSNSWLFMSTGDFESVISTDQGARNYVCGLNTSETSGSLTEYDTTTSNTDEHSSRGWILYLDAEDEDYTTDNAQYYMEYITGMPYYYKGYVFFSTFKQGKDTCSIGKSRLYCMKASTGTCGWYQGTGNEHRFVELPNVRITGLTISGGFMYVGATTYVKEDELTQLPDGFSWAGGGTSLIIGAVPSITETGTLDANSVLEPLYWRRHNFRMP